MKKSILTHVSYVLAITLTYGSGTVFTAQPLVEVTPDVKNLIGLLVTGESDFLEAAKQAKGLAQTNKDLRQLVFDSFKKRFKTPQDAQRELSTLITGTFPEKLAKYKDTIYFALEVLKNAGANLSQGEKVGYPPIHLAIMRGNLPLIQALVDLGVNLEQMDRVIGATPLIVAVTAGRDDIIKFLIDRGANVNLSGKEGTPLQQAQRIYKKLSPTAPWTIGKFEKVIGLLKEHGAQ